MMNKRGGAPGLFEFLEEADLPQYYHGLRNVLRVYHVPQLKYVIDEDLYSIGMSRPEARRLKVCFAKHNPQTYTSKLKKLLLPNTWSKDEFLLDDTNEVDLSPSPNPVHHNTGIKVPRQHIISPEAIKICKELGSGEFGIVEQGVLNDGNRTHQVAIKSLCKERLHNSMFEFMKEYEIMQSIEHANVVKLFGVVLETSKIMLITELAPLRSLLECLKEPSLRSTLNIVCLSTFAQQICQGMMYLENMRLIHRDLAARNILVFSKNLVKVSDFGLSRALGVGKDYYQTNFNANLKLPIAWCAPECITFLKFTSSSDVWAFGVTLWEMFSYGFQPWAAQTGQQILEAIDEPNCQRLDQPLHCPAEFYSIMQQCWRHDPNARPTFSQLVTILEDAKPEQVQAVQSFFCQKSGGGVSDRNSTMLEFEVGAIITVLDKHLSSCLHSSTVLWTGARDDNSCVGLFSPSQTVAYLDSLPSNMATQNRKWQQEASPTSVVESMSMSMTESVFQRGSSRSLSRSGRKKLSRDMISGPKGDVQHTGHVGIDGIHFGNVAGFFDFKTSSYASMPCLAGGGGPSLSLGPAGDSSCELAPLINSGKSQFSTTSNKKASTFDGHQKSSRNPRLGYTIGYLRNKSGGSGLNSSIPSKDGASAPANENSKHEYQSISDDGDKQEEDDDDFFLPPPDIGLSLVDEVMSELSGGGGDNDEAKNAARSELAEESKKGSDLKDLKDLVSSLTISRRQKKKLATVKPIKASDERTLENAIAMANALASKSMHELDKRTTEHFYDNSPLPSPLTPNSPTKRFSFWFPTPSSHHHGSHHRSSSPKAERKPFSEEVNSNLDLEATLSMDEKNAYKALIEGCSASKSSMENVCGNSSFNDDEAKYEIDELKKSLGATNLRRSIDNDNSGFYVNNMSQSHYGNGMAQSHHYGTDMSTSHYGNDMSKSHYGNDTTQSHYGNEMSKLHCNNEMSISHNGSDNYHSANVNGNNPLPLPPKSASLYQTSTKRHVRKNPLILSSSRVTNLASRGESMTREIQEPTPVFNLQAPPLKRGDIAKREITKREVLKSDIAKRDVTTCVVAPISRTTQAMSLDRRQTYHFDDAFEDAIANQIDALDAITEDGSSKEPTPEQQPQQHNWTSGNYSTPPKNDKAASLPAVSGGKSKDIDEVRIILKVVGRPVDRSVCLEALNLSRWDIHLAIKIIKLVTQVYEEQGIRLELTQSSTLDLLQQNEWDVAKAADAILHRDQQYF